MSFPYHGNYIIIINLSYYYGNYIITNLPLRYKGRF